MKSFVVPLLVLSSLLLLVGDWSRADSTDPILKQAAERCAQFGTEVQDMRMVQEMITSGAANMLSIVQTVYTKGKKSRVEMKLPLPADSSGGQPQAMETIMINDGTKAWMFSPFGTKKELSPEEAKEYEPSRNCWGFFPDSARVVGSEIAQGRDCYIAELVDEGELTRLWLDKTNFIPVQGETHDSTGVVGYRWVHSDFHTIHGNWEYPFLTQVFNSDTLAVTMKVTALDVNKGLSDSLFDVDKVQMQTLDLNLEDLMKMMVVPADSDTTH